MNVLVISTVWVEPTSSAAGSRMLQLLDIMLAKGWKITYASTAGVSENAFDLETLGITTQEIRVNDESFNAFAKAYQPNIVLFDRFMAEEQFGWRIAEQCPDAIKILDTEDLHCLRKARQQAVNEDRDFSEQDLISDVAKREIAAIYRCDLTLMISLVEIALLQDFFKVPSSLLHYLPFLLPKAPADCKPFNERQYFIAIGNFIHLPNWDATLALKKNIWPLIKKEIPAAELHIYGAYPSEKVMQLHNKKDGFIVKGRAEDAHEVIANALVLLAPLRFGAGLKGKFIDAMQCGTPSVTTTIGAEGMQQGLPWSGAITDDDATFAREAITLYNDSVAWQKAQEQGREIINKNFQKEDFEEDFITRINTIKTNLETGRRNNFTGQMLLHHSMRSTKFMSKWIEEKNKKEPI